MGTLHRGIFSVLFEQDTKLPAQVSTDPMYTVWPIPHTLDFISHCSIFDISWEYTYSSLYSLMLGSQDTKKNAIYTGGSLRLEQTPLP